ncbi:hypothetical protein SM007_28620 [Streptomyces avermitilis]|uniref:Secreted protein n=2 Tax=Streptomyces avermitilis TaxID=33903 RepID=Q82RN7_STRAW|nr:MULTISPECIES: hypothetical protein [Streptomyces]MYS95831.1 hypothetical protein [Streptomyces sp. SID5469]OOV24803.1 hypothetical protein SM007_28620 [Streptomyces avermitilis]BAC67815.1 putative secreted protein [Streptomyces avermitilis MA-4680 = NBRC 14893]BBJ47499.1 hypothetical protein SAVMC3_01280 [Streptomyces avermitilis]GDY68975.1 hypothetical protein SAV14893_083680 [Streptomyces avermitilis]
MFSKRLIAAAATAVVIAGLGACGSETGNGSGSGGADLGSSWSDDAGRSGQDAAPHARPDTDTVRGLRDSVRHLSRKTAKATRPHLVNKCTPATRRAKHTQQRGTGTRKKTRTWYTTEHYQDCKKVRNGTETYTRTVRPQQWCVRLDDVDGDTSQDDRWYQVTRTTYDEALTMAEHTRIEFTPAGTGC